jgi:Firmicute plasmid replication protein (RepL).
MSSKGWEYSEKTQTLIGQQKKRLVDQDTGEIIEVDQITKRAYGTKAFWKIYLMDFLQILGIFDSKQVDIFIYILENTEQANNTFIGTYSKIQEATGVSRGTVAKIMTKLQKNNFITKVQNGVWQVNPNIMMKGNDNKKQMLLSYYNDEAAATKDNSEEVE